MTDVPSPASERVLTEPERALEYLDSLQRQLDGALSARDRLTARVATLEAERARLRVQLDDARRKRWNRRSPVAGEVTAEQPTVPEGIDIPGVGTIPWLELPDPEPTRTLRVATVLDQFSRAAFGYEFQAVDLSAGDWQSTLEAEDPELLLVESAFSGVDGTWAGRVARFGEPSASLAGVVAWFRERGRPTVFWNKEDPINFDWFAASASLFDHVFTVDAGSFPLYRALLGHDRVHLLQFAAQPVIHHPPIDEATRVGNVAFAGTYYAAKHPERRQQIEAVLGGALPHGLQIFDRDHGTDPRFAWPDRFRSRIVGSLSYAQTLEAYRRYRVFLNINTVTGSPTMCARRVFELLASGTCVVSGPSAAIDLMVPPGIIDVVETEAEADESLRRLLADPSERAARARRGIEWIEEAHTMSHRVDHLLGTVL